MADKNVAPEKESAFKSLILPVIVLVAICLACSALLAVLNDVTAPVIAENELAATMEAYLSVLPEGSEMTKLEGLVTAGVGGGVTTADGYTAIKASAAGYSGKDVTVYVAFDGSGTIYKTAIDASTQTSGIGSKVAEESFTAAFDGWNGGAVSAGQPVDSIGGATYSCNAAFVAINAAIDCYTNEIKEGA